MKASPTAIVAFLLLLPSALCGQAGERWRVAFWNVENFFDTRHDTLKNDLAFTPEGENHWTQRRYRDKRSKIYKTIAAMHWPAVVGLAEVENDHVLRDLCRGTPLRRLGYEFVHYESPDQRGMDCALLYRRDAFEVLESRPVVVSDTLRGFFTRDILLVGGVLKDGAAPGDTCYLLVNHWPSKRGGTEADKHRMAIALRLSALLDSLQCSHPSALVLAMGDLNAASEEEAVRIGLGFGGKSRNASGFYDLMCQVPRGEGTYKYQGQWSCIDHILANRYLVVEVMKADFLLVDDERYLGQKPFRTYTAMKYWGGFSDHLPVMVSIP